ncbi:hypothetical protein DXG01_002226 [Tephrocybe rancida]|nr:hypothetical protein DXG01_002226 [Tephrocybe rancida]
MSRHASTVNSSVINAEEYQQLLAHANKCWPAPPSVPSGWSCNWSEWDQLITYYWFSPYYLMLPQIDMHVNIQYGVRGDTRPVLFSNEHQSFIFAISKKYFLFDGAQSALYRIKDVRSDHQLVDLFAEGDGVFVARLKAVGANEEGQAVLRRIIERDETVIPLLAEKYLDYTPEPTTPWMERSTVEMTPEMKAQYEEVDTDDQPDVAKLFTTGKTSTSDDWQLEAARVDKELQGAEDEIKRLESIAKGLEGDLKHIEKQGDEWDGRLPEKLDGLINARPETEALEEDDDFEIEDDVPPELVEGMKAEYRTLTKRVDELLKELEEFPLSCNHEVIGQMYDSLKGLRETMEALQLRGAIELGHFLATSLEKNLAAFKANPEIIASLTMVDVDDHW